MPVTKTRKRIVFTVSFELPSGATPAAAKEYVKSALLTECGFLRPEDPMSEFNRETVSVTHSTNP
jgi:hypothetical protein